MSFNKIILVGNLGSDPELRYTAQGTPVCSFNLATNERRKNKSGEMEDTTTWFRVTLWNRQAETASQYLAKGKQVYIEGRLRQGSFTDRGGVERTTLEVQGTEMQFIGSSMSDDKPAGNKAAAAPRSQANRTATEEPDLTDEDIPF